MDERIQPLVNEVKQKFKLEDYFLKRYHIFHESGEVGQAAYTFSTEWFPNEMNSEKATNHDEEDLNPDGTVIIEIDFHSKALYRLVFVGGVSHPQAKELFPLPEKADVIDWVEEITDLTFGKQFKIELEEENEFRFSAAIDHIPVVPIGTVQVEFNNSGELTVFSIDGLFPTEDKVVWEPFALLPEKLDHIYKQQFKLIDIPLEEEERWLSIYGIDEVYIRNQSEQTLDYATTQKEIIDLTLEWPAPLEELVIEKKEIDLSTEVTLDQAVEKKPHPDNEPITEEEQQIVIKRTRDFMRQEYPHDSGKWTIFTVYRESGYILSELRLVQDNARIFPRKIKVVFNRDVLTVINYIDNKMLLDMFAEYKESDGEVISAEAAFDILQNHMTVTPVYLYHPNEDMYYLYGKIDSDFGVIATNGQIVHLDEL